MSDPVIEPLPETKRWRSRDVRYWAGKWDAVSSVIPRFEVSDFRAEPTATPNPYMKSVVRLPRSLFEQRIPVGVVSNTYSLAQHHDVAAKCFEGIRLAGVEPTNLRCEVGLTELGEWMNLRIYFPPEHDFRHTDDDRMKLRVECYNSVDGSCRLVVLLGWMRLVCTNGLVIRETKTELRDVHDENLNLNVIPEIIAGAMGEVRNDKGRWHRWAGMPVADEHLVPWVNGDVAASWGKKAAGRVYHICRGGHDVEPDDPFAPGEATHKPVTKTMRVPGSPERASTLFDVGQAMSWVYDALVAAAEFFDLRNRHAAGFEFEDAKAMYTAYEADLHRFDQLYRHFNEFADAADAQHWDLLKRLRDEVEAAYVNWFLPKLALAWGKHVEPSPGSGLLAKWQIAGVRNQYSFYRETVEQPLRGGEYKRVFVIVSDDRHGAGQLRAAREVAPALPDGPAGREQLQRLRTRPARHGQEPHLQGDQPELDPRLGRADDGREPVLQHEPPHGRAGRAVGRGGVRRGGGHLVRRQGRRADHEGLHGQRLVRPRPRPRERLRVDGVRRQHQSGRGHDGENEPPARPVPRRHDRLGVLRPLPRVHPRLGGAEDAAGVLHEPVRTDRRLPRRVHAGDAEAELRGRDQQVLQARPRPEPARHDRGEADGLGPAEAAVPERGLRQG